jgi:hypothetical protein
MVGESYLTFFPWRINTNQICRKYKTCATTHSKWADELMRLIMDAASRFAITSICLHRAYALPIRDAL